MVCDTLIVTPLISHIPQVHNEGLPLSVKFWFFHSVIFNTSYTTVCYQVVACRVQMTKGLLQKTTEDQGVSEAIDDKLINKAVTTMDSMAELVHR